MVEFGGGGSGGGWVVEMAAVGGVVDCGDYGRMMGRVKVRWWSTRMYRGLSLRTSGPLQDPTTATITTIIITNGDGIWRVKTFQENNIPRIKVNNWEELAGELML
ncbi:hypothetical protein Tco_0468857 [Tanacetum coccineum]